MARWIVIAIVQRRIRHTHQRRGIQRIQVQDIQQGILQMVMTHRNIAILQVMTHHNIAILQA